MVKETASIRVGQLVGFHSEKDETDIPVLARIFSVRKEAVVVQTYGFLADQHKDHYVLEDKPDWNEFTSTIPIEQVLYFYENTEDFFSRYFRRVGKKLYFKAKEEVNSLMGWAKVIEDSGTEHQDRFAMQKEHARIRADAARSLDVTNHLSEDLGKAINYMIKNHSMDAETFALLQEIQKREELIARIPKIHTNECKMEVGDHDDACTCWVKETRR